MRKLTLSLLSCLIFLASCTGGDVEKVAEKWLTAFWHLDYELAEEYSTEETADVLKMFQSLESKVLSDSALAEARKIKVKIKEVLEEGNHATVVYTTSAIPDDQTIFLVKEDERWLVQITKDEIFGEKAAPTDPENDPNIVADTTTTQITGDTSAADITSEKAAE